MKYIFEKNQNAYNLRDNSKHENDLKSQNFKAFTYGECSFKSAGS